MALVFITGAPGSGKSAIEQKLRELGYHSYDADSIGTAYNIASNEKATVPPAYQRSPKWFAAHQWRVQREKVEQLHTKAKTETIYLCGTASNENELWDLFDQILILKLDDETLKHRLANRKDNDYGQNAFELEQILKRHADIKKKHELPRVIAIDATRPLDEVVQKILQLTAHPAVPESH